MINVMVQISTYIFLAILLGYFFGWLITQLLVKERYQKCLDEVNLTSSMELVEINNIKDELSQYKKDNKRLKTQNKELTSSGNGQKYVLGEGNGTLEDFQKRLYSKDEVIATLTSKLTLIEERQVSIENKYEEEIDAFMFERIDITKKYKDLLKKFNRLNEHKGMLGDKDSWFSKFFSSSTSSVN